MGSFYFSCKGKQNKKGSIKWRNIWVTPLCIQLMGTSRFNFQNRKDWHWISNQESITLYKAVVRGEKELTPTALFLISRKRLSVTVIAPIYEMPTPFPSISRVLCCKSLASSQWGQTAACSYTHVAQRSLFPSHKKKNTL